MLVKVLMGGGGGKTVDHRPPTTDHGPQTAENGGQREDDEPFAPAQGRRRTPNTEHRTLSGYHVTVVCYFEYEDRVVEEFRKAGAEVMLLKWKRSDSLPRFFFRLIRVFRGLKADIIHIQYMAPGFLPVAAARLAGVRRVLATVNYPGTAHGVMAHVFVRLAARLCRVFVCVSAAVERSWFGSSHRLDLADPASPDRRHLTIENSVDIPAVDNTVREREPGALRSQLGLGKYVVGTVARLSAEKGVDILVQAFARVRSAMPDAMLLIVGSGSERIRLNDLAARLGVDSAIRWVDGCPWEDAMRNLSLMDVVVVPSRFEGFGLVAAEAMACGKPVVASRVDGLVDVVEDGVTGSLAPAEDAAAFGAAISRYLSDVELRRQAGAAGRRRVEELFSLEGFSQRWRDLYDRVCAERE